MSFVVGLLCRPRPVNLSRFTIFDVIPLRKQSGLAMLQDMPLHITCPSFSVLYHTSAFSIISNSDTTPTCHMPTF